jgi:hypothetical protein
MDRAGGVNEGVFFLRNGGFFENPVPLNSRFTRPASGQPAPVIDFAKLEGVAAGFEPAPAR